MKWVCIETSLVYNFEITETQVTMWLLNYTAFMILFKTIFFNRATSKNLKSQK